MTLRRCSVALALASLAVGLGVSAPVPTPKEKQIPFVAWALKDDFKANEPHNPLVVKDLVIVGTDKGELRAYRCKDGDPVWVQAHGRRLFHTPCSDGERVFYTSESGLSAVAVKDGARVWSLKRGNLDGPTVAPSKKGLVVVAGDDGMLLALDAKNGMQRWVHDFVTDAPPPPAGFPAENARMAGTKARPSALSTDGELIYVTVMDQSRVVAVEAATGKRVWAFQTGGWVFGSAAATGKHVFFGSYDRLFYCLEKRTGKKVWSHATKGRISSGPAVDTTSVYVPSCDGGVYCLNQSDGKLRWRFATDGESGGNGAIYSTPVLRGACLYLAAGEGQAYAINRETGKLKWKLRPSDESEMFCCPATDGDRYFVVTRVARKGRGEASLIALGQK
jgi:outer membrane protein assembly factor BamB